MSTIGNSLEKSNSSSRPFAVVAFSPIFLNIPARRDFRSADTGVAGRNASTISTSPPPAPATVAAGVFAAGVFAAGVERARNADASGVNRGGGAGAGEGAGEGARAGAGERAGGGARAGAGEGARAGEDARAGGEGARAATGSGSRSGSSGSSGSARGVNARGTPGAFGIDLRLSSTYA